MKKTVSRRVRALSSLKHKHLLQQLNQNLLHRLVYHGVECLSPEEAEALTEHLLNGWTIELQIRPNAPGKKVGLKVTTKVTTDWLAFPSPPQIESPRKEMERKNFACAKELMDMVKREKRPVRAVTASIGRITKHTS